MATLLAAHRLRFGPFVLDTRRVELQRDGIVVPLRPKPFALLATLARRPGTVLSREALFAELWPGVVVSDDSLTKAVGEVRAALGDEGAQLVRTVARHGYRFDAIVVDDEAVPALAPPQQAASPPQPAAAHGWEGVRAALRRAWPRSAGALALAGAMVVAGVFLAAGFVGGRPGLASGKGGPAAEAAAARAPRLSLVVLPLEVEPGSDSGDWFSDPLTGDLTIQLAKVSGMLVISRDTAHTYKGRPVDPREVARELKVRYVFRGTVGRKGNDVRLNLALIDGETGRQRWAEKFDLDRTDLARALKDVTGLVSRTLGMEVYRAEGQRAAALKPEQVEADDLAMKGWAVWLRGLSPDNAREALALFEQAVARDRDSLRGWSGVGLANATAVNLGWVADPAPARARQREALHNMERIDADDMLTWFARVDPYYRRQDFDGLLQLAQVLVARFPYHPESHHQHAAAYLFLGRFEECIPPGQIVLRLSPRDPRKVMFHGQAVMCYFGAGRYADAVDQARLLVQERPTSAQAQLMLAATLARNGRLEEARKIVRENEQQPMFRQQTLRRLWMGTEPQFLEARDRFFGTLKELGVP